MDTFTDQMSTQLDINNELDLVVTLELHDVDLPVIVDPNSFDGTKIGRVLVLIHTGFWEQVIVPFSAHYTTAKTLHPVTFRFQKTKLDQDLPDFTTGFQIRLMNVLSNHHAQTCVAFAATTGNLLLYPYKSTRMNSKYTQQFYFENLKLCSPPIRNEYPDYSFVKGTIGRAILKITTVGKPYITLDYNTNQEFIDKQYQLTCDRNVQDDMIVRKFLKTKLEPFFTGTGLSTEDSYVVREWYASSGVHAFRPFYSLSMQNIGLVQGYLSALCLTGCYDAAEKSNTTLGTDYIYLLFEAALARNPEVLDWETWRYIITLRLFTNIPLYPTYAQVKTFCMTELKLNKNQTKALIKSLKLTGEEEKMAFYYLFIKCIDVVSDLLTVVPNSLPYLADIEIANHDLEDPSINTMPFKKIEEHIRSQQQNTTQYPKTSTSMAHSLGFSLRDPYLLNVERIGDIRSGYGADCEDFAVYSATLARKISMLSISLNSNAPKTKKIIVCNLLKSLYQRFVPCVANVMCKGSHLKPIYHSVCLMIPRGRFYDAEKVAIELFPTSLLNQTGPSAFSEGPDKLSEWELPENNYIGAFVCEGTYVEEPHKFYCCEQNEQQRTRFRATSQFRVKGINTMRYSREDNELLPSLADRLLRAQMWNCKDVGTEYENLEKYNNIEHPFYSSFFGIERAPFNWREAKRTSYVVCDAEHTHVGMKLQPNERSRGAGAELVLGLVPGNAHRQGLASLDPLWEEDGQAAFATSVKQYLQQYPAPLSFSPTLTEIGDRANQTPWYVARLLKEMQIRSPYLKTLVKESQIRNTSRYEKYHLFDRDLCDIKFRENVILFLIELVHYVERENFDPYYKISVCCHPIGINQFIPGKLKESELTSEYSYQVLLILYY